MTMYIYIYIPIHYTQGHDAWGSFIDRLGWRSLGPDELGSTGWFFCRFEEVRKDSINVLQMSNSSTQSAQILMILRVPIWYLGTRKLETILSLRIIHSGVDEFETSIAKPRIFLLLPLSRFLFVESIPATLPPISTPILLPQEQQVKIHPEEHFPSRNVWTMTTPPGRVVSAFQANGHRPSETGGFRYFQPLRLTTQWKMDLSYWIIIHNSWPGAYISTEKKEKTCANWEKNMRLWSLSLRYSMHQWPWNLAAAPYLVERSYTLIQSSAPWVSNYHVFLNSRDLNKMEFLKIMERKLKPKLWTLIP